MPNTILDTTSLAEKRQDIMTRNNKVQNSIPTHIYTPAGPRLGNITGRFVTIRQMWRELIQSRELIVRLYARDFSTKYRQSALGVLWVFLVPLITVAIFAGMNRAGVFNIEGVTVPYALYALIGLSAYNLFNGGILVCTTSLVYAGNMLTKINFPKIALVFAASLHGLVDFAVRTLLIAVMFIVFAQKPHLPGLFLGLLALIPFYFFMVGLGFFLSMVTAVIRDISNIVNFASMGLMMATPVLYPITGNSLLARMNVWNPFNYFINVPRDLILQGHSNLMFGYVWCAGLACVVFYTGWRFFYFAQTRIAERV